MSTVSAKPARRSSGTVSCGSPRLHTAWAEPRQRAGHRRAGLVFLRCTYGAGRPEGRTRSASRTGVLVSSRHRPDRSRARHRPADVARLAARRRPEDRRPLEESSRSRADPNPVTPRLARSHSAPGATDDTRPDGSADYEHIADHGFFGP